MVSGRTDDRARRSSTVPAVRAEVPEAPTEPEPITPPETPGEPPPQEMPDEEPDEVPDYPPDPEENPVPA